MTSKRWTTAELQEEFEVLWFAAPICGVMRKSDGVKGTMWFMRDHDGVRRYFDFQEDG